VSPVKYELGFYIPEVKQNSTRREQTPLEPRGWTGDGKMKTSGRMGACGRAFLLRYSTVFTSGTDVKHRGVDPALLGPLYRSVSNSMRKIQRLFRLAKWCTLVYCHNCFQS
jgi:hypothetical protein